MRKKSELMRERRKALKDAGLVPVEVWVQPENKQKVKALDERGNVTRQDK